MEIWTAASGRSEILAPEFSVVVHPMLSLVASYQAGETCLCLLEFFFLKKDQIIIHPSPSVVILPVPNLEIVSVVTVYCTPPFIYCNFVLLCNLFGKHLPDARGHARYVSYIVYLYHTFALNIGLVSKQVLLCWFNRK